MATIIYLLEAKYSTDWLTDWGSQDGDNGFRPQNNYVAKTSLSVT